MIIDSKLDNRYLDQLIQIDRDSYQIEPEKNFIEIAEKFPWSYTVLRRGDSVLGYSLVLPLKKASYQELRRGRLWEDELRSLDIDESHPEGFYIASIAASERVKGRFPIVAGTLVGLLGGQVLRSSKEILSVPITRTGESVSKMMNLRKIESELNIEGVNGYKPQVYIKKPNKRTPLNIGN